MLALAALAGCGVDTATTAATSAAIKKEEVEQGRKTMGQAQQKVEQAAQQMQERARRDSDTAGKQ
jgi:small-conductance mechanosensitive channel